MAMETLIAELNRKLDDEHETLDRRYRDYGAAIFHNLGSLELADTKSAVEAQLKVKESIANALTEVRRLALTGIET